MEQYKLGEMQQKFADIIWDNQPIGSRALTELCTLALGWKRTTTYTMLKGLCDKGIFKNEKGTVIALMTKEDFAAAQGEQFLSDTFGGSLPQFLAAFTRRNKLSQKEIGEIQSLINEHKED